MRKTAPFSLDYGLNPYFAARPKPLIYTTVQIGCTSPYNFSTFYTPANTPMASIREKSDRLYLSATCPCKDGSPGKRQYDITLGMDATPSNYKLAYQKKGRLEKSLKDGTFAWADWITEKDKNVTWQKAIAKLYRKKVLLGRTSESTWEVNYMGTLKLLDQSRQVTTTTIKDALSQYRRDQYTYKKLYYLLKDIASLTGVPFPEVGVPTYGKKQIVHEVPSDQEIVRWVLEAGEPHSWYFGMMATYGLRPHEVEKSRMVEDHLLQVFDETKTGYRTVVPCPDEWVELFNLQNRRERAPSNRVQPRPDEVAQFLIRKKNEMGIPWRPYSLRHAFAARLWKTGGSHLDVYAAAKVMGHSMKEHIETYRSHIDPHVIAKQVQGAFQRNREDFAKSLEARLED